MNRAAIIHQVNNEFAFPIKYNGLLIRIKAARGDLKEVKIVYGSRYPLTNREPYQSKKMELVARDEEYDYFSSRITVQDARFRYMFYLDDGQEKGWFNEKGFTRERPTGHHSGFFHYPMINKSDLFEIPDWVYDAVFYQIFPDRFYNGDPENDPGLLEPWGKKPDRDSFYGGDLGGIIKKLDYLSELGINAIYLTPIFLSPSNHKYNIDDYYQIDPHFGDLELAKKLVCEAHQRGIRIILDAVFNHCGYDFFAFKDVREKGQASRYVNWFEIDSFPVNTEPPVNYRTFANNIAMMPRLNTSLPAVREYLITVASYWTRELDLDGWRLDVADEVDHHFWREFRQEIKAIKPDAYIVGEVWHNAQAWLKGDQFDAVMNYSFTDAVCKFMGTREIGPTKFDACLSQNRMLYHQKANYAMLNILDSHDTSRVLHIFQGNKESLKLAILFQMSYQGLPMIYYGDEIGLSGDNDPDCRRCMPWDQNDQDLDLLKYYRKLIKLRYGQIALRRGKFRTIMCDDLNNVYCFKRKYQQEELLVLLNNSPVEQQVKLALRQEEHKVHKVHKVHKELKGQKKAGLTDLLTDRRYLENDGYYLIKISPFQGMILK